MDCPKCVSERLSPVKLEQELPAYGCGQCHGALVSLLYYRDWAERTGNMSDASSPDELQEHSADDSAVALACPKCRKLMRKYRVSNQCQNRLDLCLACDEVWLDGGEWQWLKALHLEHDLVSVFSDQWQRKVKLEEIEKKHRDRFAKLVGEEAIEKAEEVRIWLKDHPHRQDILYYLSR